MTGETWVPSRFNVSADLPDGRKAVFNAFSVAVVKVDSATWERFLSPAARRRRTGRPRGEPPRVLRDKRFLVPRGLDELDLVRLRYQAARFITDALMVRISPTLACNLRCDYCYQGMAQSLRPHAAMNRRTQDAAVCYVAAEAQGKKGVRVTWFGGEPLLGLGAIERMSRLLIPALDKALIRYAATIQTNGILAGRRAVDILKASRVMSAQVTVDVPRSKKRDARGRDTLDRALDGAAALADAMQVNLRINLSRDDEAEFDALYEALLGRGLQKRLRMVYVANVYQPECGRGPCAGVLGPRQFLPVIARERRKAGRLGFATRTLFLNPLTGCSATCSSGVVVAPDGGLCKCPEDVGLTDRAFGSVFDADVKCSNVLPWLTYDWFRHRECRKCPLLPQCAGGCPHQRMFQARDLKRSGFCFWSLRGGLEDHIREYAMDHGTGRPPAIRRK